VPEGTKERVLEDVLGIGLVADQGAGQPQGRRRVGAGEPLELPRIVIHGWQDSATTESIPWVGWNIPAGVPSPCRAHAGLHKEQSRCTSIDGSCSSFSGSGESSSAPGFPASPWLPARESRPKTSCSSSSRIHTGASRALPTPRPTRR